MNLAASGDPFTADDTSDGHASDTHVLGAGDALHLLVTWTPARECSFRASVWFCIDGTHKYSAVLIGKAAAAASLSASAVPPMSDAAVGRRALSAAPNQARITARSSTAPASEMKPVNPARGRARGGPPPAFLERMQAFEERKKLHVAALAAADAAVAPPKHNSHKTVASVSKVTHVAKAIEASATVTRGRRTSVDSTRSAVATRTIAATASSSVREAVRAARSRSRSQSMESDVQIFEAAKPVPATIPSSTTAGLVTNMQQVCAVDACAAKVVPHPAGEALASPASPIQESAMSTAASGVSMMLTLTRARSRPPPRVSIRLRSRARSQAAPRSPAINAGPPTAAAISKEAPTAVRSKPSRFARALRARAMSAGAPQRSQPRTAAAAPVPMGILLPIHVDAAGDAHVARGWLNSMLCAPTRARADALTHARTHARLKRDVFKIYFGQSMMDLRSALEVAITAGRMRVKPDAHTHVDTAIHTHISTHLMYYNHAMLRLGLETVLGRTIACTEASQLPTALKRVITQHLLVDRDMEKAYAHTRAGVHDRAHAIDQAKRLMFRLCVLVCFLDACIRADVQQGTYSCLFAPSSPIKSSAAMLAQLMRVLTHERGYNRVCSASCLYTQTRAEEVNMRVTDISQDLRDGIRLTRCFEILSRAPALSLVRQLRIPAPTRMNKLHNVDAVLTHAKAALNVTFTTPARGRAAAAPPPGALALTSRDIVDGHLPETLSLVWAAMRPSEHAVITATAVADEVAALTVRNVTAAALMSTWPAAQHVYTRVLKLVAAVCAASNVRVRDFADSMADGRALALFIAHYEPELLPRNRVHTATCAQLLAPGVATASIDLHAVMHPSTASTPRVRAFRAGVKADAIADALRAEHENWTAIAAACAQMGVPSYLTHVLTRAESAETSVKPALRRTRANARLYAASCERVCDSLHPPAPRALAELVTHIVGRALMLPAHQRARTGAARTILHAWRARMRARATALRMRMHRIAMFMSVTQLQRWYRARLPLAPARASRRACLRIQRWFRRIRARKAVQRKNIMRILAREIKRAKFALDLGRKRDKRAAAAVVIQAHVRGYLARKATRALLQVFIRFQANVRGTLVRRAALGAAASALGLVQESVLPYLRGAAMIIQRFLRARFQLHAFRRARQALISLQMHVRARYAHIRALAVAQEAAATKIAAVFRGWWARRVADDMRAAVVAIQRSWRAYVEMHQTSLSPSPVMADARPAAMAVVQRAVYAWYTRMCEKQLVNGACAVIIASMRAFVEMRRYTRMRMAVRRVQRWWRHTSTQRVRTTAVVRIQAVVRRIIAQRRVGDMLFAAVRISTWARARVDARVAARAARAAALASRPPRAAPARNRALVSAPPPVVTTPVVLTSNEEEEHFIRIGAAALIQSMYRCHRAYEQYQLICAATRVLQRWWRICAARAPRMAHVRRAAVTPVPATRTYATVAVTPARFAALTRLHAGSDPHVGSMVVDTRGMRFTRRVRAAAHAAATRIQACMRGYAARLRFTLIQARVRYAVVVIQRAFRASRAANVARKRFVSLRAAVRALQAQWRGIVVRRTRAPEVDVAARRVAIACSNARAGVALTLASRTTHALRVLARDRHVVRVCEAVAELELATRLSHACVAACVAVNATPVILTLMRACNRSLPHMHIIAKALGLLGNMTRACGGKYAPAVASAADIVPVLTDIAHIHRDVPDVTHDALRVLLAVVGCSSTVRAQLRATSSTPYLKRLQALYELAMKRAHARGPASPHLQLHAAGRGDATWRAIGAVIAGTLTRLRVPIRDSDSAVAAAPRSPRLDARVAARTPTHARARGRDMLSPGIASSGRRVKATVSRVHVDEPGDENDVVVGAGAAASTKDAATPAVLMQVTIANSQGGAATFAEKGRVLPATVVTRRGNALSTTLR